MSSSGVVPYPDVIQSREEALAQRQESKENETSFEQVA